MTIARWIIHLQSPKKLRKCGCFISFQKLKWQRAVTLIIKVYDKIQNFHLEIDRHTDTNALSHVPVITPLKFGSFTAKGIYARGREKAYVAFIISQKIKNWF